MSIAGFPWNWSTWTLLSDCIDTKEQVTNYLLLIVILIITPKAIRIATEIELACDASPYTHVQNQDFRRTTWPHS